MASRARVLLRRFPELNVIVVYREASEEDLAAACQAGVSSLVPESHGLAAVLALVRRRKARHAREVKQGQGGLTDREREIVVLTGSGHIVPEIAALLGISPERVENLKRRVYAKLEVNSSAHAVARAASLGMLGRGTTPAKPAARRRPRQDGEFPVLSLISGGLVSGGLVSGGLVSGPPVPGAGPGRHRAARQQTPVRAFHRAARPRAGRARAGLDTHWARWHRGPVVAVLVDPEERDWDLVADLSIPAILVHSKPFDSPELAGALATGASALVAADRIDAHFLSVLRMVSQGYLVVDSMPMRPLIEAAGVRWDEHAPGQGGLPELTSRESDILSSLARGHSIRQTARELGIAPKTVENVQTRLFRKLGVRNRAGALAVADAFGLLPPEAPPVAAPPATIAPV